MDSTSDAAASRLLDKVRGELTRYEHLLLDFSAAERAGVIHLVISLKNLPPGAHVYEAPLHTRDLETEQFPWNFQRMLYDCLHDYLVELFVKTPQSAPSAQ